MTDALPSAVYDGDTNTYINGKTTKFMKVDPSLIRKKVAFDLIWYLYNNEVKFLDSNKEVIESYSWGSTGNYVVTVPEGAVWISVTLNHAYNGLREIGISN